MGLGFGDFDQIIQNEKMRKPGTLDKKYTLEKYTCTSDFVTLKMRHIIL